jgi:hypothetical protein
LFNPSTFVTGGDGRDSRWQIEMSRLQLLLLSAIAVIDGVILMVGYAKNTGPIPPPPASGLAIGLMIALVCAVFAFRAEYKQDNVLSGRKWMAISLMGIQGVFIPATIDTSIAFTYIFASLSAIGFLFFLYVNWADKPAP